MQIQKINFNNYNFCGVFKNKKDQNKSLQNSNITSIAIRPPLEIVLLTQLEDEYFQNFLAKKGKVSKQEYNEIIKKHPRCLVKAKKMCDEISKTMCCNPEIIARISCELKRYLDEVYKNYTIISVGTSPAPVTEVMKNLGAKVIFLPISGLKDVQQSPLYFNRRNFPTLTSKHENFQLLMDYCTKKGIAKKDSGTILVLDLCVSGKSAQIVKQLLKERGDISFDNIFIHDVTTLLEEIIKSDKTQLTKEDVDYFDADMRMSRCARISNVPHFYYDDSGLNNSKCITRMPYEPKLLFMKRLEEFSKLEARAWSLVSLHEALKIS